MTLTSSTRSCSKDLPTGWCRPCHPRECWREVSQSGRRPGCHRCALSCVRHFSSTCLGFFSLCWKQLRSSWAPITSRLIKHDQFLIETATPAGRSTAHVHQSWWLRETKRLVRRKMRLFPFTMNYCGSGMIIMSTCAHKDNLSLSPEHTNTRTHSGLLMRFFCNVQNAWVTSESACPKCVFSIVILQAFFSETYGSVYLHRYVSVK